MDGVYVFIDTDTFSFFPNNKNKIASRKQLF